MIIFIWILTGILLICFALITSFLSMRDYLEHPNEGYSLFLIRNAEVLTHEFFNRLQAQIKNSDEIVSFEKLSKGERRALVIYLPKSWLKFFPEADFLELLDYSEAIDSARVTCWEIVRAKQDQNPALNQKILSGLELSEEEQVFFQVVIQGGKEVDFKVTMRGVVFAKEAVRRLELARRLEKNLEAFGLERKSGRQNSAQLFQFYKKRSAYPKEINGLRLSGARLKFLLD